ncbi:MAG: hypothetical protein ABIP61_16730 [Burkholderiaceae bacterium]
MMHADRASVATRAPASFFTPKAGPTTNAAASRPAPAVNTSLGRQFKVLQSRGAPAQMSLFQRPAGR